MHATPPAQAAHRPDRRRAILLVGPTGSGKTPLGDLLETTGLWGRPCVHFDFGAALRACAAGRDGGAGLTSDERGFVGRVLGSEALLEDEQFPIAEKLFRSFLARRAVDPGALVVLNGLPRHVGQATDMEPRVAMQAVVCLSCTAEVVWHRIRTNAGGDRTGRVDDGFDAVRRKVDRFRRRTEPLVAYYRDRGTPVVLIDVAADTTAGAMEQRLRQSRAETPQAREAHGMLHVDDAVLVVVDVQGKLARLMHESEALLADLAKLIRGAHALGVPIIVTEQNPAGLGPTVPELSDLLPAQRIAKTAFSCCGEGAFVHALEATGRRQVLLCGIETHICVYQTALDLLGRAYEVHVVADGVSSRTARNRDIGLGKIERAGGHRTSVETALFELLKVAEGDTFKAILKIVK
ncbi:MAG TPA: nucleoside monophosphate kinase [Phycisphaerae bacterium]|nr:nucleoside monophosphate kinase [Phycisphaerae bacterium]HUU93330.1 nucleoside monophosphate kinase [Phycisphaerae bacterium]